MSRPLKKYSNPDYGYPYSVGQVSYAPARSYPGHVYNYPNVKIKKKTLKSKKRKSNPIKAFISLCFLSLIVYYVFPLNFQNLFEPMFLNRFLNRNLKIDAKQTALPTLNYLSNAQIQNEQIFVPVRKQNREMAPLTPSSRMYELESELSALAKHYPHLHPSIYVWDYITSRSAEINPNELYSSASIIKLPVLIELFRKIESLKAAGLPYPNSHEKLLYDEIHKADGSGHIQFEKTGKYYSIDYLAKAMIQDSDNSATNMLLDYIGGMDAVNSASRKWGLESTKMNAWLPDLRGTNTISAEDIATLLYNIDNPKFLNEHSRYMIKQYMSNVHNNRLLHAGIPKNAEILHKTGDIGTMLGDAGIIYAPNGKKYIAVVLVERPFNDYSARDFIKEASKIIYNSIALKGNLY